MTVITTHNRTILLQCLLNFALHLDNSQFAVALHINKFGKGGSIFQQSAMPICFILYQNNNGKGLQNQIINQ